jgi:hypothetical protein
MDPFAAFLFGAALTLAVTVSIAFVWWMLEHMKRLVAEKEHEKLAAKLDNAERMHALCENQNRALIAKLHQMDGHIHHLHQKLASGGGMSIGTIMGVMQAEDDDSEEISGLN